MFRGPADNGADSAPESAPLCHACRDRSRQSSSADEVGEGGQHVGEDVAAVGRCMTNICMRDSFIKRYSL